MQYVLVCSPGGSGLKQAVEERLLPHLRDRRVRYFHEDVEDVLCGAEDTVRALRGQSVPPRPNVGHVTHYLPRTQVVRLWKRSLGQSLVSLHQRSHKAGGNSLNLLSCHLDLYGGRRRELYSPIDMSILSQAPYKASHVLLLIDDIYDMYVRLAKKAALYDELAGLTEYVRQQQTSLKPDDPEPTAPFPPRAAAWNLEWRTTVLANLLAWRRAEMLTAEAVAHQLGAKYMVFAVKQSVSAVSNWLLEDDRPSVYISHPITRPRNYRREHGDWPLDNVVQECNGLQRQLDAHGVTCVMPTGIDELRFAQTSAGRAVPRLDTRWPTASVSDDFVDTLYVRDPAADQPELTFVLLEESQQNDALEWRPWMNGLSNQIRAEVAFRDHHLVANSPGLLVLRPFYEVGTTSHGVAAEVDHWRLLAQDPELHERNRRAAFIHFADDVAHMLRAVRQLKEFSLDHQILNSMALLIEGEGFSPEGMAKTVMRRLSDKEGFDSLLDAGLIPPHLQTQLRDRLPELRATATARVLEEQLTLQPMPPERAGIWIVESEEELEHEYPQIAEFLRGSTAAPSAWIQRAQSILQTIQAETAVATDESVNATGG